MASAIATSVGSSLRTHQRLPSPAHSDTTPESVCCQERLQDERTTFVVPPEPSPCHPKGEDKRLHELSTRTTELSLRDDELGSSDEVKVFKDEGEEEKEFISSEEIQAALLEDKSSLIQETELSIKEECSSRMDIRGQHRQHGKL